MTTVKDIGERFSLNFKGIVNSIDEHACIGVSAGCIYVYTNDPDLFLHEDVLPDEFEGLTVKFMKCELPITVEN